ncbi:MAG TPA: FAD-dependent oxidoreductase [Rhizomicrobium sp.]|nr:FAD-dependent oxidoreductase [Rhizomicrobium sp.]
MEKIAVIGTGIAGLSAAYLLNRSYEVTVYEKEARLGGHSRTVDVRHGDRTIAVDTGFIVFNEQNYPNLTALFRHLDVPVKKSDMSFALTVGNGWLEWGAKDLAAILGQRRNLIRPQFIKLFADVMRFNKDALAEVKRAPDVSVGGLLQRMGLGDWFRRHYLLPMAGAIWSCPPCQMLEFPASSLVQFFANHNLLSVSGQPQWMTVDGGSQKYVERLAASLEGQVRVACGAVRVERTARGARVTDASGETRAYDEVVLACHSDEALALLTDASAEERAALGAIRYQPNRAVLHKDESFMPKRKACWASWVYHSDGAGEEPAISVSYWMNNLQGIDKRYPLFVTLNPAKPIAPEDTFDTHLFAHPVFDFAAMRAQTDIMAMQGARNTWFCGAYLGYGFHEDGLKSGMKVAEMLGAPAPWVGGDVSGGMERTPWREVDPVIAERVLAGE